MGVLCKSRRTSAPPPIHHKAVSNKPLLLQNSLLTTILHNAHVGGVYKRNFQLIYDMIFMWIQSVLEALKALASMRSMSMSSGRRSPFFSPLLPSPSRRPHVSQPSHLYCIYYPKIHSLNLILSNTETKSY